MFITAGDGLDSAAEMLSVNSWHRMGLRVVSEGNRGHIHRHWSATRGAALEGITFLPLLDCPRPKTESQRCCCRKSWMCVSLGKVKGRWRTLMRLLPSTPAIWGLLTISKTRVREVKWRASDHIAQKQSWSKQSWSLCYLWTVRLWRWIFFFLMWCLKITF